MHMHNIKYISILNAYRLHHDAILGLLRKLREVLRPNMSALDISRSQEGSPYAVSIRFFDFQLCHCALLTNVNAFRV